MGSKVFRDFLDHDRTGQADPERVEEVLDTASAIVAGLLLEAFGLEQLIRITTEDKAVAHYCVNIAMGIAATMKPGLLDAEGKNPYIKLQATAEKKLEDIANAHKRRAAGEEIAGRNRKLGVSVNRNPMPAVFAATKKNRIGPGGF